MKTDDKMKTAFQKMVVELTDQDLLALMEVASKEAVKRSEYWTAMTQLETFADKKNLS